MALVFILAWARLLACLRKRHRSSASDVPSKALHLARIILTRQELPASVFVPGTLLFVLLSKFRNIAMKPASAVALTIAVLLSAPATASPAAKFGTAQEAKALLSRAVAAVKSNVVKALTMFNNGQNGFKDRDLYVLCANAKDGSITPHQAAMGRASISSDPAKR